MLTFMTERRIGNHFIKQWREYRRLSQEKTVGRMEFEPGGEPIISAMSLSRIERGTQPYSEEVLNALGHALDAEPWELLSVNPLVDGKVIDLMRYLKSVSAEDADKALRILKAALAG